MGNFYSREPEFATEKIEEEKIAKEKEPDEILSFDCRGTIIKTYKSCIEMTGSTFLKGVLYGEFVSSEQEDGSYFLDCDPQMFQFILDYTLTGKLPHTRYQPLYLREVFTQFGMEIFMNELGVKYLPKKSSFKTSVQKEINSIFEHNEEYECIKVRFIRGVGDSIFKEPTLTIFCSKDDMDDYVKPLDYKEVQEVFFDTINTGLTVIQYKDPHTFKLSR